VTLPKSRGSYTMEAIALVAALCIVAVFLFSYMQRQADRQDAQARRFAEDLAPRIEQVVQQDPQAELTARRLAAAGVTPPEPLRLEVPPDHREPGNWRVRVWHPEGRKIYLVSASGMTEDYR
jgi:hypothetical protein